MAAVLGPGNANDNNQVRVKTPMIAQMHAWFYLSREANSSNRAQLPTETKIY